MPQTAKRMLWLTLANTRLPPRHQPVGDTVTRGTPDASIPRRWPSGNDDEISPRMQLLQPSDVLLQICKTCDVDGHVTLRTTLAARYRFCTLPCSRVAQGRGGPRGKAAHRNSRRALNWRGRSPMQILKLKAPPNEGRRPIHPLGTPPASNGNLNHSTLLCFAFALQVPPKKMNNSPSVRVRGFELLAAFCCHLYVALALTLHLADIPFFACRHLLTPIKPARTLR